MTREVRNRRSKKETENPNRATNHGFRNLGFGFLSVFDFGFRISPTKLANYALTVNPASSSTLAVPVVPSLWMTTDPAVLPFPGLTQGGAGGQRALVKLAVTASPAPTIRWGRAEVRREHVRFRLWEPRPACRRSRA
jgi:hypothetical protein